MAAGKLRAVVCTSSLDLGVDWGDVDLVINVGAPKGCIAAAAADRPLQPPARRAVARPCWCRPTASRCWNAAPRSTRSPRTRRTRRRCAPARSTCWRSTFSGARLRRAVSSPTSCIAEVRTAAPYARARARGFRRRGRFRRHRRLRAEGLRALRQDPAGQGRPLAHHASARGAALPHECRHHRRSRHAEGAAGALARERRGIGPSRAAAGCSARSRNISSRR